MQLLIVDTDKNFREHLAQRLADTFDVHATGSLDQALRTACRRRLRIVLLDLAGFQRQGLEFLQNLQAKCPQAKVILINHETNVPLSISAMKLGAYDEMSAPIDLEVLADKIKSAGRPREK